MPASTQRAEPRSLSGAFTLAPRGSGEHRYHGFISYSHAADADLAPALERGLKRFAKPWYRTRALNVFRDDVALSANPDLWGSVREALDASEFLILLASPPAAASVWVARETSYWREHKPLDHLLIVLTEGELRFGDQSGRGADALPAPLHDAFASEPRWTDLRWARAAEDLSLRRRDFADAVAEIAAPLHGVGKEELASEEVRQHRRTVRLARAAVAAIAALLALAIVAAVVAVGQRNTANQQRDNARRQATIATSRQLAALSTSLQPNSLSIALPLAVGAYRVDRNAQSESALFGADLASPKLVRYLPFPAVVAQVAGSADGRFVVAGLANGQVMRWRLGGTKPQTVLELGQGPVTGVAVSANGDVIAATNGSQTSAIANATAEVWSGGSAVRLGSRPKEYPYTVTVSPTGHTVAVAYHTKSGPAYQIGGVQGRDAVQLFAYAGWRHIGTLTSAPMSPTTLMLPTDKRLMMLNDITGQWTRLRVPDLWTIADSTTLRAAGTHEPATGYSNDGGFFALNRGGPEMPVWEAPWGSRRQRRSLQATAPVSVPTAMTISPGGTEVAVAQSGTIYIATVGHDAAQSAEVLTGNDEVNSGAIRFARPGELLSAVGDSVTVWNLDQIDRLAIKGRTRIDRNPCDECTGAAVAVSPDGERVALLDDKGTAVIQNVSGTQSSVIDAKQGCFGPPTWEADRRVLLPYSRCYASGTDTMPAPAAPAPTTVVRVPGDDPVIADAAIQDGRELAAVNASGAIFVTTVRGRLVRTLKAPSDLAREHESLQQFSGLAAIDATRALAAEVGEVGRPATAAYGLGYRAIHVRNLGDGRTVRTLHPGLADAVAYAGGRLLVQLTTGQLAVYTANGAQLLNRLPGDTSFSGPPAGAAGSSVVARLRTDGSVALQDLGTGATVATLPPPAPDPEGLELGLGYSSNGSTLVESVENYGGFAPFVLSRDLSPAHLATLACDTAGASFTATDWRSYVGTAPPTRPPCS